MVKFAPNLFFMYREHDLMDRFQAARRDGFRFAELCYLGDLDVAEVKRALDDAGLTLLSFNFPPGEVIPGEKRGLSALPGHQAEFRELAAQGLDWAAELGAGMALCPLFGLRPEGVAREDCEAVLIGNLQSILPDLEKAGLTLLIEAHCSKDFPGYIIDQVGQARRIVDALASPHVRILFDTYHTQRMEGDLSNLYQAHRDVIAHIQVGNPPGRNEPDCGEVDHRYFFEVLDAAGYDGWVSGEYFAKAGTSEGLGFLEAWGIAKQP